MLAKLSKNLLLDNISTSFATLPLPSFNWKDISNDDMRMYSKSQSLMIFSLSDTDAVKDYLEKVRLHRYLFVCVHSITSLLYLK